MTDDETGRLRVLQARFDEYILAGIPELRKAGYNPTQFLEIVRSCGGVVSATRRLLADPRHTSYGFQRLYEIRRLEASVEYAVCLPWFEELFTAEEISEASGRLMLHEFPLQSRLETLERPQWTEEL